MKKKGFWEGIWYSHYENWFGIYEIFCAVIMIGTFIILISIPTQMSLALGILVMVTMFAIFIVIALLMQWLAEQYLRNYDADYRWHLKWNRGEKL